MFECGYELKKYLKQLTETGLSGLSLSIMVKPNVNTQQDTVVQSLSFYATEYKFFEELICIYENDPLCKPRFVVSNDDFVKIYNKTKERLEEEKLRELNPDFDFDNEDDENLYNYPRLDEHEKFLVEKRAWVKAMPEIVRTLENAILECIKNSDWEFAFNRLYFHSPHVSEICVLNLKKM